MKVIPEGPQSQLVSSQPIASVFFPWWIQLDLSSKDLVAGLVAYQVAHQVAHQVARLISVGLRLLETVCTFVGKEPLPNCG
jgi:hypothetical protein